MATKKGTNKDDKLNGTNDEDDLFGYKGNDKIFGDDGDDWIVGHQGKDTLSGGDGEDTFVYAAKSDLKSKNADKLKDFDPNEDTILFDYDVFKHVGFGQLKDEYYRVGNKAQDSNDYFIFNQNKAALYYDSDANGNGNKVKILAFAEGSILDGFLIGQAIFLSQIPLGEQGY